MNGHYLICAITGKTRKTTPDYLEKVCRKHNLSADDYKRYYISREAAVMLNAGKTVEEIRLLIPASPMTAITDEELIKMRSLNVTKRKKVNLPDTKV